MTYFRFLTVTSLFIFLTTSNVFAQQEESQTQPCPPEYRLCLNDTQVQQIRSAIQELKDIKDSPAQIQFQDNIILVRDQDGRLYVNGGELNPLRLRLTIGDTISRDMEMRLPIEVHARPRPPEKWFRLRMRAQVGVLFTQFWTDNPSDALDGGVGWDFFQIPSIHLNFAGYTGVRSLGAGAGIDLTRNFGIYGGYSFIYDGFSHSPALHAYFSFN